MRKPKLTPETESLICEAYLAGEEQVILAERYGVSGMTIRNILRRHNVPTRPLKAVRRRLDTSPRKRVEIDLERARSLYEAGWSMPRIAKELGTTTSVVEARFAEARIPTRKHTSQYTHNDLFFSEYTRESCYWAGFIAADGCVQTAKPVIVISLHQKDIDHLEKFPACCEAENPVPKDYTDVLPSLVVGWREGLSTVALSRKYGMRRHTVSDLLKSAGIQVKKRSKQTV